MKKFTLSAVFIFLVLAAFCQPKNHPCPIFKRNNGQGTCGGDAQIRVYWADCSDEAPILTAIYYEGKKLEGNTYGTPDQEECRKKGYTSYCIYGNNIPPAKKLTLHFTYSDGAKTVCEVPEGPPVAPPPGNCPSNNLFDANGYYYGGFEAGIDRNNFSSTTGQTDMRWGSMHGGYQIVDDISKAAVDLSGGGYLNIEAHSGENFMLTHTGSGRIWYSNLTVVPGTTYTFCSWIASAKLDPPGGFPVELKVMAGSTTTTVATGIAQVGVWSQVCGTYTVPSGVTSIQLQIVDPNPSGRYSNFLALDDICFGGQSQIINPDINVTYVNVPVPGNVATNDKVASGTTYGPVPTLISKPNNSTYSFTQFNSNGTYTFVANKPGVYTFKVPVCGSGQTTNCPTSLLTISVLEKNVNNNPPVANTDIATTKVNTAVTINSLANDRPGNLGGTLHTAITITSQPKNGTVTVNSTTGATTYTPNAGFVGMDTLTYRVCEIPSGLCATALQIIRVQAGNVANTTSAADDYATTPINTAVSGNVKTNDTDAEGHTQTVVAQTTTVSGKGTLVLNSNGTYTFTPVAGFTGPVSFAYTTCDNGTPQACASATLYILVSPAAPTPNLTPIIEYLPSITHGVQRISVVTTMAETKGINTNGVITVYVARDPKYTIIWDPTATSAGGKAINNSVWTLDLSNPGFYIFRTTSVIAGNSFSRFGFDLIFNPNNSNGQTTITATIDTNSGGESTADAADNTDSDVLVYFLK